ncbi:MAG: EAL domain-containing protein [Candidatus Loosdrechtia sp.]|uniref:EAL domain-containing protein n=1 Tax=Candidatus Loosdrechtia sp. TaxID=3101272 RepID=UPI003A689B1E|nr:MAG: EAL domain-containing protein [Candidatus Jettenia sp. AMX2]
MEFLIIDDNSEVRRRVTSELEKAFQNAEFTEIHDRSQFDAILTLCHFDAVITNINNSWLNGLDVCLQIKLNHPYLPVIVITSTDNKELMQKFVNSGVSDCAFTHTIRCLPIAVIKRIEIAKARREYDNTICRLRASGERINAFLNSSSVVSFIKNEDGRFIFINDKGIQLLKATEDELLGKTVFDLYPPEKARELYEHEIEVLSQNKVLELYKTIPDHDGVPSNWWCFLFPVKNSSGHRYIGGIAVDITRRKRRESLQMAQFTLTHILAESATLDEAAPKLLQAVCEGFAWEYGELWHTDTDSDCLRLKDVWHVPSREFLEFKTASFALTFPKGIGLPGRVWKNGQPVWITDVTADSNFNRASIASSLGIHSAMAFPVMRKNEVIGVMEFFTKIKRLPDKELFDHMADIGRRIGAFIDRKLAERALTEQSYLAVLGADIGMTFARGGTLRAILQQCTEAMVRNLCVAFARIWILNEEENVLELQSSAGIYTHINGEHSRIPVGMYKIGLIAKERKPHLTNNVISDSRIHNQEWAKQTGLVAFAGYPLIIEGRIVGVIAMFSRNQLTDITIRALASVSDVIALGIERKRTEETRIMLSEILEMATDFTGTFHTNGNLFYINKAGREMLGVGKDEDIKKLNVADCYPHYMKALITYEAIPHAISNGVWMGETVLVHRDGREIPVSQVITAHMETGTIKYLSTIARDITERKHFESQVFYMTNRDQLTNLYNRRRFHEELENRIMQRKGFCMQAALLFLDIDNFKYINDSLGYQTGDMLLINLAGLLKERLRKIDVLARLGGDEFAIILTDIEEKDAIQVANQLRVLIRQNASLREEKPIDITVSIGIAMFPKHGNQAGMLYSCADLAMYRAKEEGRNRVCVYSPEQMTIIESRYTWEKRIRESISQNHFVLHLQPILDLHRNSICGYEALLRMTGDKGELIYPNQFLDIAERFGLIHDIDQWVISESIAVVKTLQEKGKPAHLEINLSGKSLNNPGLLQLIKERLIQTGIDPGNVVFEITETSAIENIVDAERFIMSLKNLGCRFALDDFGIGFSSFNYLKHLSVDYLKIDGSFIQNLPISHTDKHLVKAMVEIAHGLGKKIIAEWVISEETILLLRKFGVDYAQGYFIGKPVPLEEL